MEIEKRIEEIDSVLKLQADQFESLESQMEFIDDKIIELEKEIAEEQA
jgi:hypothetical protein